MPQWQCYSEWTFEDCRKVPSVLNTFCIQIKTATILVIAVPDEASLNCDRGIGPRGGAVLVESRSRSSIVFGVHHQHRSCYERHPPSDTAVTP